MDKTFFIYFLTGLGFAYLIITNVNSLQQEDERYQNRAYQREHMYDKYYTIDSVGQEIVNVIGVSDFNLQKQVWNNSFIRTEYIDLFPDFEAMRMFIKERVEGEPLKNKLLNQLNREEDAFISGEQDVERTKMNLSRL